MRERVQQTLNAGGMVIGKLAPESLLTCGNLIQKSVIIQEHRASPIRDVLCLTKNQEVINQERMKQEKEKTPEVVSNPEGLSTVLPIGEEAEEVMKINTTVSTQKRKKVHKGVFSI